MTPDAGDRRVGQLRNDVDDLYELVTDMDHRFSLRFDEQSATLDDHTTRLDRLETKVDHVIDLLTGR